VKIEIKTTDEIKEVIDHLFTKYKLLQDRTDIHVSDCIYCTRKTYFNKIGGLKPDKNLLYRFLKGLALEDTLLGDTRPKPLIKDDIILSPDWILTASNGITIPLDLKTTMYGRKRITEAPETISRGWLRQIMAYAYAMNVNMGVLLLFTIGFDSEFFPIFYTFEKEELKENWTILKAKAVALRLGLKTNKPPIPMFCVEDVDKDSKVKKLGSWECKDCLYQPECYKEETK
jgi:hypothetical protein